jgi:hypothetical protein
MDSDRDMTATIIGTNAGLAVLLRVLLAERADLDDLARKADDLLFAHAKALANPPRDFELAIDEQALRTVANIIADAKAFRESKAG